MTTTDTVERAARQRKFYLDLSPAAGQHTAVRQGFTTPSIDTQEAELKDSVNLWMRIQRNGMADILLDTSWWMSRMVDPYGRKSEMETGQDTSVYQAYAVATVQSLIDSGILDWTKDTPLPEVKLTGEDLLSAEDRVILDSMEQGIAAEAAAEAVAAEEAPDE